MSTRCKCGVFLKGSQRRCKACAIDCLKNYETDRFERQVQDKPIVLDFSPEQVERWTNMSDSKIPPVARTVRRWSETDYRRRSNRKMWYGVALILVVLGLIGWALANG